jgi:hypothetical protein
MTPSLGPAVSSIHISRVPLNQRGSTIINLANLLLRDTSHRITILQKERTKNPELYVVTRIEWRDPNPKRPLLSQYPRLLSLLETMRGTDGVPTEIYLDSMDGLAVFFPTGVRLSNLPEDSKECIQFLMVLVEYTVTDRLQTMREVEKWFWRSARRMGFSPTIVERMARGEPYYDSIVHLKRYNDLLHRYFSVRFIISRNEPLMRLENA